MSQERAIQIEVDVLGANKAVAQQNRAHFASHGVSAFNLVSSPGSGKTTLLCASIEALRKRAPGLAVVVIEGDQQTSFDADRIRATGAPAIQVNTGKGCHLDAPMVARAFGQLDLHAGAHAHTHGEAHSHSHAEPHTHSHEHVHAHPLEQGHKRDYSQEHARQHALGIAHDHSHAAAHAEHSPMVAHTHSHDHDHDHDHDHAHAQAAKAILFIENVGNLVCPAMWDLGEDAKVVILSVTEGEDKPLKYPDMFAAASLMLLNKVDLLPHLRFDVVKCIDYARRVNPGIRVLLVSAQTGQGMDAWLDWVLGVEA
jgi:hydrogenase nickel incorporation protein HypB